MVPSILPSTINDDTGQASSGQERLALCECSEPLTRQAPNPQEGEEFLVLPSTVQLTMAHARAVEAAKEALEAAAKAAAKARLAARAAAKKPLDPAKVRGATLSPHATRTAPAPPVVHTYGTQ